MRPRNTKYVQPTLADYKRTPAGKQSTEATSLKRSQTLDACQPAAKTAAFFGAVGGGPAKKVGIGTRRDNVQFFRSIRTSRVDRRTIVLFL